MRKCTSALVLDKMFLLFFPMTKYHACRVHLLTFLIVFVTGHRWSNRFAAARRRAPHLSRRGSRQRDQGAQPQAVPTAPDEARDAPQPLEYSGGWCEQAQRHIEGGGAEMEGVWQGCRRDGDVDGWDGEEDRREQGRWRCTQGKNHTKLHDFIKYFIFLSFKSYFTYSSQLPWVVIPIVRNWKMSSENANLHKKNSEIHGFQNSRVL